MRPSTALMVHLARKDDALTRFVTAINPDTYTPDVRARLLAAGLRASGFIEAFTALKSVAPDSVRPWLELAADAYSFHTHELRSPTGARRISWQLLMLLDEENYGDQKEEK